MIFIKKHKIINFKKYRRKSTFVNNKIQKQLN